MLRDAANSQRYRIAVRISCARERDGLQFVVRSPQIRSRSHGRADRIVVQRGLDRACVVRRVRVVLRSRDGTGIRDLGSGTTCHNSDRE